MPPLVAQGPNSIALDIAPFDALGTTPAGQLTLRFDPDEFAIESGSPPRLTRTRAAKQRIANLEAADEATRRALESASVSVAAEEAARIAADAALDLRVTATEGDITSLDGRVTATEGDISALQVADASFATSAALAAHEADTTTHGITAAAATVNDDATVADMVNTLFGASSTGSGGAVRATGAALVTPNLGTPTAGSLGSCTNYPLAQLTGAGANVLAFLADPTYQKLIAAVTGATPVSEIWIRQAASRTLTDSGSTQKIFDSVTNGTLTIETGVYFFEMMLYITAMSGTSGNILVNILGAGTATSIDRLWFAVGLDATTPTTAAAVGGCFAILNASAQPIVVAGTGTAVGVSARGTFDISVAGTFIPALTLNTAGVTPTLLEGSYFKCHYVAPTGSVSAGNWS